MSKKYRKINMGFTDGSFKEGNHIVYIYNDDQERKRTMAKFLGQGLLEDEKLLYLVHDITPEEMAKEFEELGLDIKTNPKAFDITQGHFAHCPDNHFSGEFMLGIVKDYYENAIQEGFSRARGAGEMSWALLEGRATIQDLLTYEAKLNNILEEYPLTTVCQYDARRFDGSLIMDLLCVHPMMIIRGQLVHNPHYIEPEVFLKEYKSRSQ